VLSWSDGRLCVVKGTGRCLHSLEPCFKRATQSRKLANYGISDTMRLLWSSIFRRICNHDNKHVININVQACEIHTIGFDCKLHWVVLLINPINTEKPQVEVKVTMLHISWHTWISWISCAMQYAEMIAGFQTCWKISMRKNCCSQYQRFVESHDNEVIMTFCSFLVL